MNLNEMSLTEYKRYCKRVAEDFGYDMLNPNIFKAIKACKSMQELADLMAKHRRML